MRSASGCRRLPTALYRLLTTVLDAEDAPARELAALYHERWEIETAFDELKTHLRGARIVLRSKTPELVRQEFWGLMLAHYAIRALMYEAARQRGDEQVRRGREPQVDAFAAGRGAIGSLLVSRQPAPRADGRVVERELVGLMRAAPRAP